MICPALMFQCTCEHAFALCSALVLSASAFVKLGSTRRYTQCAFQSQRRTILISMLRILSSSATLWTEQLLPSTLSSYKAPDCSFSSFLLSAKMGLNSSHICSVC